MSFKQYVSGIIQELQQNVANKLNKCVNKYSNRTQKIGFIVISLSVSIFCFLLIIGKLGSGQSEKALKIDTISVPKDIRSLNWDSLKRVPAIAFDSLNSLLRKLNDH